MFLRDETRTLRAIELITKLRYDVVPNPNFFQHTVIWRRVIFQFLFINTFCENNIWNSRHHKILSILADGVLSTNHRLQDDAFALDHSTSQLNIKLFVLCDVPTPYVLLYHLPCPFTPTYIKATSSSSE